MRPKILAVALATCLIVTATGAFAGVTSVGNDTGQLAGLQTEFVTPRATVNKLEHEQRVHAQTSTPPRAHAFATPSLAAWSGHTKVSGTSFVDFTRLDQAKGGKKPASSGTGLDVKRFYVSIDHSFNTIWSANLTTDFNYSSRDGESQLFVKKAYLQGAFSKLATLRVGSANMPWIPFVEDWYGYRFVENTLIDRLHFGNSADWGLHMLGADGVFNYQVSAINGGGYKDPSRSNHIDFAARVGVQPIRGLMFAVGTYDGDLGQGTQTMPALHRAKRYDAMAAWDRDGLRLGAEWFRTNNWKNITAPVADAAEGWSLWSSYDFPQASVFARYDHAKPSQRINPALTDTYWNAGVAFPITRGIRLALAYKYEHLGDGSGIHVTSREIGAWGEVKW